MKRSQLKHIAQIEAASAESKGYYYWLERVSEMPKVFFARHGGQKVQIEVQILEQTDSYILLGVSACDESFLATHFPPGWTAKVEKGDSSGTEG